MNSEIDRPLGVALISIFQILVGLLMILGGIAFIIIGAAMSPFLGLMGMMGFIGMIGGVILLIVSIIILGIITIIIGIGMWNGREWARLITLILSVLGLLVSILALPGGLVGIIINALIIYYLTRNYVKKFFT
jgi:hypothetical protein